MKCIVCGALLDREAAFCEQCGTPVNKCLQCGAAMPVDAVFCEVCGARVAGTQDQSAEFAVQTPSVGRESEKDVDIETPTQAEPAAAQKRFCPQCGVVAPQDASFCEECGAALIGADPEEPQAAVCRNAVQTQQSVSRRAGLSKNAKIGLMVSALIVLIALLVVLAIVLLGKTTPVSIPEAPSAQASASEPNIQKEEPAAQTLQSSAPASPRVPGEWIAEDWPEDDGTWPEETPIQMQPGEAYLPNGEIDPEMLILEGNERYYSMHELMGYSQTQLGYVRNGLYALSGKKFKKDQYIDYFNSKDWYYGYDESDESVIARMNDYQRANLELCIEYEQNMGWR